MTAVFATHSGTVSSSPLSSIGSNAQSVRDIHLADQVLLLQDGRLTEVADPRSLECPQEDVPEPGTQPTLASNEGDFATPRIANTSKREPSASKKKDSTAPGLPARVVGTRKKSTYRFYLQHVGILQIALLLAAVVSLAFSTRFQRVWVGWWTQAAATLQPMYIGVYFLLAVGACLSFTFFFWSVLPESMQRSISTGRKWQVTDRTMAHAGGCLWSSSRPRREACTSSCFEPYLAHRSRTSPPSTPVSY